MAARRQWGRGVGTRGRTAGRLLGRGQNGGLHWAEDRERSFAGRALLVVGRSEQGSPEYGVC